jgi:hypothetical protein
MRSGIWNQWSKEMYGVPTHCRSDLGMDNFNIVIIMKVIRGQDSNSIITSTG